MYLRKNYFLYTVVLLFIFMVAGSFYRFVVLQDYIVSFEGDCDPYTESCYVECEDDECTEEYYFTIIERMAYEIRDLCGSDVLECDAAYECQPDVAFCEISYCDPDEEDSCEHLEASDRINDNKEDIETEL